MFSKCFLGLLHAEAPVLDRRHGGQRPLGIVGRVQSEGRRGQPARHPIRVAQNGLRHPYLPVLVGELKIPRLAVEVRPLVFEYPQAVRVECPDPHSLDRRLAALAQQGGQPQAHLVGAFLGEGRHEQPLRVHALGEQAGHAARQHCRLARPRTCQNEGRAAVVIERLPLLLVQPGFEFGDECGGAVRVQVFGDGVERGLHDGFLVRGGLGG